MSGFDRTLGAMSRQELLECARGLLKFLAGEAGAEAGCGGGAFELEAGPGRAGGRRDSAGAESGAPGGGFRRPELAERAGREAGRARDEAGRGRRGFDGPEGALGGFFGEAEAEGLLRRGRRGEGAAGPVGRGPARDEAREAGVGAAVFSGPERRFESAAGARGMEMSRVSDYFRRDSRRYDAGFTRF